MRAAAAQNPAQDLAASPAEDPTLRDLKRLLLRDEHRDLAGLQAELARLDRRVGSEDRFCRAVADSLVVALKVVEVENHRALTEVIAPLVVAGIRREIAESRDLMVETLYPIAGRMVAAAIAAAFRQLSDEINETLSRSPRRLWLRLKALLTGQSYAALVLAELVQGRLERLILIDRGTGAVLATTDRDGQPDADPDGQLHLVGGLVTAIVEFAGQALSDVNGELRSLDFGGRTVLLRASPLLIVAGLTEAGRGAGRLAGVVDAEFLPFLDAVRQRDELSEDDHARPLAALHRAIAARLTSRPRSRRPVALAGGLVAVALAAWIGSAVLSARQRAAEAAALAAIEAAPDWRDAPLHLAFDREVGLIRATGVLPSREAAAALRERLAASFPAWPVAARIAVASEAGPVREAVATLDRRTDAVEGSVNEARTRLGSLETRTEAVEATLPTLAPREAVARLEARTDTPLQRLEDAVKRTAIFFGPDATYRDPEAAERDLATLAATLKAVEGARLRIVGYADGTGSQRANLEAARLRADRITADLERRGIPRARLVVVNSRPPYPITDERVTGNRRVVFELAYSAE
ncbi:OmpA family protein [Methylobacterium sp. 174MFSha1.1]|uniref:OmpA family protein n=1 Tax=Methylobacterium sp. 174MFSha1.1 TaxID=1502749 RepID=UPI0008F2BE50|nr:OmpA family protein [Methylobacterium sp. 174MFSha1.1]SFU99415.1 OmpA family protein [Methylobacterium sp. 174MFSha1.1]